MSSRIHQTSRLVANSLKRWHDFSNDPNTPEVLAARRDALKSARADIVEDRITYLCNLVRGRRILDIGVVEHFLDARANFGWIESGFPDGLA
jgi:hypothetical protein